MTAELAQPVTASLYLAEIETLPLHYFATLPGIRFLSALGNEAAEIPAIW